MFLVGGPILYGIIPHGAMVQAMLYAMDNAAHGILRGASHGVSQI